MKKILQDLTAEELSALAEKMGEKKYRAEQLFHALMLGKKISEITTLPAAFKEALLDKFEDEPVKIIKTQTSSDGTEKYLFGLSDGGLVEGVFMRYKYGNTVCVSTQVGCRMGCAFCASTVGGLKRNLTSGEILSEVLTVNAIHGGDIKKREVTNIVLMGSGEPLDNYDAVVKFIRCVSSEGGINISPRNISLSTCGLVPQMYDFANEGLPVNLTVSLHAPDDETRARIMPAAKRYKISDILKACSYYFEKTGRRYIFEYSLIKGVNSDEEHAKKLIKLLSGRPCHVNLIRLNEVKETKLFAAEDKEARAFLKKLTDGGLSATLRRRLGSDIAGACGQLRAGYLDGDT
ncbi:MAG: 23S rRNA (adenine(2503)-C(2))-methyltransferase RlmN [Clostridia bacterium]|nr:23S rRNA (adenine(2503)-C(2))-methyltransferase RlmN [Clostridia bacterium]